MTKRSAALLEAAIGWLDAALAVDVVPYSMVEDTDAGELADPLVAVTVVTGSTSRDNYREEKLFVVEVEASASGEWVESNGTLDLHRLLDDVSDVLTTHKAEWGARGESGGSETIQYDEDRNRYLGARRYDLERTDFRG